MNQIKSPKTEGSKAFTLTLRGISAKFHSHPGVLQNYTNYKASSNKNN